MHIRQIRVQNLRAVKDCAMTFDGITALVGRNGAGKSTLLDALMLFQGDRTARRDDYYNGDTEKDIKIEITFAGLPGPLARIFPEYIQNGELGIACVIRWKNGKAVSILHGCFPGNPDFKPIFNAHDHWVARRRYIDLCKKPEYSNFPEWQKIAIAKRHLLDWERKNPDKYDARRYDEELSGDSAAAAALLSKHMRFIHIPAVRDATTGARGEQEGSVLDEHLANVIKKVIPKKAESQNLEGLQALCDAIMAGKGLPELDKLKAEAGRTLGAIAPGAALNLEWVPPDPKAGLPRAEPRLVEDGYPSPVDMAGHGLQRAFVMASLLHQPPRAPPGAAPEDGPRDAPSLVLAIEEPELYQHPIRLRHLAALFRSAAERGLDGVAADHVQIVYATHSPLLVSANRISEIRLVRRGGGDDGDGPMSTTVYSTTVGDVCRRLGQRGAPKKPAKALELKILQSMDPAVTEGFFADAVVLVEGLADQAAICAAADMLGNSLDAMGVSVISCGGKGNMPKLLALFGELGIPAYAVWDADSTEDKKQQDINKQILSLLRYDKDDWRGKIGDSFACLEANLEETVAADLASAVPAGAGGDPYGTLLAECEAEHGRASDLGKPLAIRLVMETIKERSIRLETLESIVAKIAGLAGGSGPP